MEKITVKRGVADTPQAQIFYKDSGQGTPILMLHGNAQTHLIFAYYEKKLSRQYRTILMDSRAHGHSRVKPPFADREFATADMARDAAALLDTLHIDACILLGFSDGANVALEFASLFPSRTLAVLSFSGNVSPDGLIFPVRLFYHGKYRLLRAVTTWLRKHNTTAASRLFHSLFHQQQLTALLCASPRLTKARLAAIHAPVLLIAGTNDVVKVSHSRQMAKSIPGAQLLLVRGATHLSLFLRKQFYLQVILRFLKTL